MNISFRLLFTFTFFSFLFVTCKNVEEVQPINYKPPIVSEIDLDSFNSFKLTNSQVKELVNSMDTNSISISTSNYQSKVIKSIYPIQYVPSDKTLFLGILDTDIPHYTDYTLQSTSKAKNFLLSFKISGVQTNQILSFDSTNFLTEGRHFGKFKALFTEFDNQKMSGIIIGSFHAGHNKYLSPEFADSVRIVFRNISFQPIKKNKPNYIGFFTSYKNVTDRSFCNENFIVISEDKKVFYKSCIDGAFPYKTYFNYVIEGDKITLEPYPTNEYQILSVFQGKDPSEKQILNIDYSDKNKLLINDRTFYRVF